MGFYITIYNIRVLALSQDSDCFGHFSRMLRLSYLNYSTFDYAYDDK